MRFNKLHGSSLLQFSSHGCWSPVNAPTLKDVISPFFYTFAMTVYWKNNANILYFMVSHVCLPLGAHCFMVNNHASVFIGVGWENCSEALSIKATSPFKKNIKLCL